MRGNCNLCFPRSGNVFVQPLRDDGNAEAKAARLPKAPALPGSQVDITVQASDGKHQAHEESLKHQTLEALGGHVFSSCTRLSAGRVPGQGEGPWLCDMERSRRGRLFTTEEPKEPSPVTPPPASHRAGTALCWLVENDKSS